MLLEVACASVAAVALQRPFAFAPSSPPFDDCGGRMQGRLLNDVQFGPGVQLGSWLNPLEHLADQVQHMEIDGPAAASDGPPEVGGACFLGSVFRAVPPAELQVSVPDPVSEPVAPLPFSSCPLLLRPLVDRAIGCSLGLPPFLSPGGRHTV
jgi:hypothetical protein